MTERCIGRKIAPLLLQAAGLARIHEFLECCPAHERIKWIASFIGGGTVTAAEADMLLEYIGREVV
jgi:hypothetical protein